MRPTLGVTPPQVPGHIVQCSCSLAMKSLGQCSEPGPGEAEQGHLLLPALPALTPPQKLSPPDHGGLSRAWSCCNRRPLSAGLSAPVVPCPRPVSQRLAGHGAATPHHLKPERGPFFPLSSSFLPCLREVVISAGQQGTVFSAKTS